MQNLILVELDEKLPLLFLLLLPFFLFLLLPFLIIAFPQISTHTCCENPSVRTVHNNEKYLQNWGHQKTQQYTENNLNVKKVSG